MLNFLKNLPKAATVKLIEVYQLMLSPDHSWLKTRYPYGFCKHYPSCSEYSKQAIIKYGFFKGIVLGAKRVASCNPWAEPKFDPIHNS